RTSCGSAAALATVDGPRLVVAVAAGPAGRASASGGGDGAQRVAALGAGSVRVATTRGLLGPDRAASVRAAAEGFLLGSYRVPRTGGRPVAGPQPDPPATLTLLAGDGGDRVPDDLRDALARGIVTGQMTG